MNNKKTIEEQVAELTEEQKEKILKVDLISGIVLAVLAVPVLVFMFFTMLGMLTTGSKSMIVADGLMLILDVLLCVIIAIVVGILVFVKVKYPYYTSARCKYIRKMKKTEKYEKKD